MRKITLLLFSLYALLTYAQYPQSLPLDYTAFFATTAINENGTDLERAIYAGTSDPININQWNRGGKLTSGEGGGISPILETSTLSYTNYIDNEKGIAILLDPNIQPDPEVKDSKFRSTIYSLTDGNLYRGNSFYLSVLVNISAAPSSANDFLTFDANHCANSQRGRVFVKSASNGVQFGLGYNGQPTTWSTTLELNKTHLIVLKVTPVNSGDETFSLYINPTIGEREDSENSGLLEKIVNTTPALKQIRGITIRQRTGIGAKLAGLRFSNNWEDVVKAGQTDLPSLVTPEIGEAGNVASESFTANWNTVDNAVGYNINLYQGSTLVNSYSTEGQVTNSLVINGLWTETAYTYTVTAKGNGTDYSDSEESSASQLVTTLAGAESLATDFNDGTWGEVATETPSAGAFPSSYINNFYLSNAVIRTGNSNSCPIEITHRNRIHLDAKNRGFGQVTFPIVQSAQLLEIHATAGTAGNGFTLMMTTDGSSWSEIGTYTNPTANENIHIIPVSSDTPVRFRIDNANNGAIYIYQIIVRNSDANIFSHNFYTDGGWQTICFPNSITKIADNNGTEITGYKLKEFTGITTKGDETTLSFGDADFPTVAGKPYLLSLPIVAGQQQTEYKIHANAASISSVTSDEFEAYAFTGTYSEIKGESVADKYVLNENGTAFVQALVDELNGTIIPANGAYLTIPSGPARRLTVNFGDGGGTTGLLDTESVYNTIYVRNGVIYINSVDEKSINIHSIDGCLVRQIQIKKGENTITGLSKGIYLINNSKVIVH